MLGLGQVLQSSSVSLDDVPQFCPTFSQITATLTNFLPFVKLRRVDLLMELRLSATE